MNALQVFSYDNNNIRTIDVDGDVWFVAKDVCNVLELNDVNKACERLDDDEKLVRKIFVSGQNRDVITISESGFYALVLRSNKPEAKNFSRWVRKEVLPQIRKTGSYSLHGEQPALPSGVLDGARLIFETAGIKDNQLTLALDKVYRSYTGRSALDTGGVTLEAPVKQQLLTPTELAVHFGFAKPKAGARIINKLLEDAGYQRKIAGKWKPLSPAMPYAVMLDTGKAHSDGTPVRSLKWGTGIIGIIETLIA